MTKRTAFIATVVAAVVATSETVLVLQLVDAERARRKLADWKRDHHCPHPYDDHPPVFPLLVFPAPMEDPALADPVDAVLDDQPEEVRRG